MAVCGGSDGDGSSSSSPSLMTTGGIAREGGDGLFDEGTEGGVLFGGVGRPADN